MCPLGLKKLKLKVCDLDDLSVFEANALVIHYYYHLPILSQIFRQIISQIVHSQILCFGYLQFRLPYYRGQFIELRSGLINVSPIGRNCTSDEREIFIAYDKVGH